MEFCQILIDVFCLRTFNEMLTRDSQFPFWIDSGNEAHQGSTH